VDAYHGSSWRLAQCGGKMKFSKRAYRHFSQVFLISIMEASLIWEKINSDTAAMIVETIQGEAGISGFSAPTTSKP